MAAPSENNEFAQLLFGGFGFALLAGLGLLLLLASHKKRLLQQQRRLRVAELHQQQLLATMMEAQEGERAHIGQTLYEGLGSSIATARLLLHRLAGQPGQPPPPELLRLVEELMSQAARDVRHVAHHLYPAVLARFGLAEAVQHLVDVTNEGSPVPVALELDYRQALPLAQELALYRICQELLLNALQHARGASRIEVRLHGRPRRLLLAVEDDGCGFAPAPRLPAAGTGLRGIEARVQLLGGRLARHSVPGSGTRMAVELDAGAGAQFS